MASFYIHMDQGIIADLRNHTLGSAQFSSCAPIVFYNSNTHKGGLYHLGGCSNLEKMQTTHLRMMETLIQPTVIYVLSGSDILFSKGHIGPVTSMFERREVLTQFNGCSSYYEITIKEYLGSLSIEPKCKLSHIDFKLDKGHKINLLPEEVVFIGEKDDKVLSKWF